MEANQLMLAVAIAVTLANAGYMFARGPHFRRQYVAADLPHRLTLTWGTLIVGLIAVLIGEHLTPNSGALLEPAWGVGVAGVGASLATVGWLSLLIDTRSSLLPTELTWVMGAWVVSTWALAWVVMGMPIEGVLAPSLGAVIWLCPVTIGHRFRAVGLGDVRLAPVLGFALGTMSVVAAVVGLIVAYVTAGAMAFYLTRKGAAKSARFPLGPFLLIGTWVTWSLGALIPMLAAILVMES